jgi:hypothetical protein
MKIKLTRQNLVDICRTKFGRNRLSILAPVTYKGKVKVKVKVQLSLCLTKHHAMKTYLGVEV